MKMLAPFLPTQNLSVDNALSTIQLIHQLQGKINEVVEFVNQLETDSNDYTDDEIKKLDIKLSDDIVKSIKASSDLLNASIEAVDNSLTNRINTTDLNLNNINQTLTADINNLTVLEQDLKSRVETLEDVTTSNYNTLILAINNLRNYVDSLFRQTGGKVYNPTNGKFQDIQTVINDLFNLQGLNIGNVTVKYVKKLFTDLPVIDNVFNVKNDMKFLTVKVLATTGDAYVYLNVNPKSTETNTVFVLYSKLESAIQYGLYEMMWVLGRALASKADISIANATVDISKAMYTTLGYGYTDYLPVSFAWYDSL